VRRAAVDRLRAYLARGDLACVSHLAAGDDRGRSLDDVHHVHDVAVELHVARLDAAACVQLVPGRVEQEAAGLELLCELGAGEERRAVALPVLRRERGRAGERELLVLVR
jgi:hypothetical protein